MNRLQGKLLHIVLFSSLSLSAFSQSLDQAKKLYMERNFEEAKPAIEKLVNQSPTNSTYNLWYGVCCYETGDLVSAEKHLLVAQKKKVIESYRYLAHIYTASYRFSDAIIMWEDFIEAMSKKKEDTESYEMELEQVEKMFRMKEKVEDVQIIDSIVANKNQILSSYYLSEDCGSLESSDAFLNSINVEDVNLVYVNPKKDQAYYGRLVKDGKYSIFSQFKLMGVWGDEKMIFPNDTSDNNYPFVLGDGVTLYFASKNHGSIGGYDLFITRYNRNQNSYLAPEQMGMPFNSPANDYLMVIDEVKGLGWFVSDRNQPEGKVCVYLFIPDDSRKRLPDTEDKEILRKRAALTSIQDTWTSGTNYTERIRLAKTNISSLQKEVKKDFSFIINDQITYSTWSDFRSSEAKSFYEKVTTIKEQIHLYEKELDNKRKSYLEGNESAGEALKASILETEEKIRNLHPQTIEWEKKARNTEVRTIKK